MARRIGSSQARKRRVGARHVRLVASRCSAGKAARGAGGFHPDRGRLRLCRDRNDGDQYLSAVAAGDGAHARRIKRGGHISDHGLSGDSCHRATDRRSVVGPVRSTAGEFRWAWRFHRRHDLVRVRRAISRACWSAGRSRLPGVRGIGAVARRRAGSVDGQMLAKVMAMITVATAAALGFSPLLGGMLDHFFGWRATFVFVAVFAVAATSAYAAFVGETSLSARTSMKSARDRALLSRSDPGRQIPGAGQDVSAPNGRPVCHSLGRTARAAGKLCVVADHARMAVCRRGFRGVRRGMAGIDIVGTARPVSRHPGRAGIDSDGRRRASRRGSRPRSTRSPCFSGRLLSSCSDWAWRVPLASAAALSPFGSRAGIAASLLGFAQMAGAAAGTWLAASVSGDPALGLGIVLALASPLALMLAARSSGRRSPALS